MKKELETKIWWIISLIFLLLIIGFVTASGSILGFFFFLLVFLWMNPSFYNRVIKNRLHINPSKPVRILVFVMLLIIAIIVTTMTAKPLKTNPAQTSKSIEPENQYIDESLAELFNKVYNSGLTELQQKELWKSYKGKYVKWEVYVNNIDTGTFTEYEILGSIRPKGLYDIGSDVGIHVKSSEKDKLMDYYKGDLIKFEGKLERLSGAFGLAGKIIYVTDATILSGSEKNVSENTNDVSLGEEELIASCIAGGIPVDICIETLTQRKEVDNYDEIIRNAVKNQNTFQCNELDELNFLSCLSQVYIAKRDTEACFSLPELTHLSDSKQTFRGFCLEAIAEETENHQICELITYLDRKRSCECFFECCSAGRGKLYSKCSEQKEWKLCECRNLPTE